MECQMVLLIWRRHAFGSDGHRTLQSARRNPLLPNRTLVEGQLVALQDVSITPTTLARTGRDDRVEAGGLELTFQRGLDLAHRLQPARALLLHRFGHLLLELFRRRTGLGLRAL